jgi:hypothetical protein
MATTAVFVEILIVGFEAAAWLVLLVFSIFGTDWFHPSDFKGWEALVTVFVFAGAYVLGILIDRVADRSWGLFKALQRRMKPLLPRRKEPEPEPNRTDRPEVSVMRLTVMARSEGMANFLEYQRSRLRIARATIVNLVFAIPSLAIFLAVQRDVGAWEIVAVVIIGLALLALAVYATVRVQKAFDDRLDEAYDIAGKLNG